jgi:hypothetical protein
LGWGGGGAAGAAAKYNLASGTPRVSVEHKDVCTGTTRYYDH